MAAGTGLAKVAVISVPAVARCRPLRYRAILRNRKAAGQSQQLLPVAVEQVQVPLHVS